MRFRMDMGFHNGQTIRNDQVIIDKDMVLTESLFPRLDELFKKEGFEQALRHVSPGKQIGRYNSPVDYLLCELYPDYKLICQVFYRGDGLPLRHMITEEKRVALEEQLVQVLDWAKSIMDRRERISWDDFRRLVM